MFANATLTDQQPGTQPDSIAAQFPYTVIVVICVILIVCLSLVVYYFSLRQPRERVRYTIVMHLMALIITAFVAFLALSTGTMHEITKVQGGIAGFAITFVGVPAIWAAVIIFLRWFDSDVIPHVEEEIETVLQSRATSLLLRRSEERLGWIDYNTWKARVAVQCRRMIEAAEVRFIDDLLPKAYYHGDIIYARPSEPKIRTLFIYTPGGIIKFQRIEGRYSGNGNRPRVYLPSTTSTGTGRLGSVHFFARDGVITDGGVHQHGAWVEAPHDVIDCLICTLYENDVPDRGDYLYVDTRKYLPFDYMETAEVELSTLVLQIKRKPGNITYWQLRGSTDVDLQPVPLIFRPYTDQPQMGTRARAAIKSTFSGWAQILAAPIPATIPVEATALVGQIGQLLDHPDIAQSGLSGFLDRNDSTAMSFVARQSSTVLISLFEWV
jgi:hypothetical protein